MRFLIANIVPLSPPAAVDFSKGTIGRLCTETNTFVIDAALGEFEFEKEENELVLKPTNKAILNGEFGIFAPVAAAAAPPAAGGAVAGGGTVGVIAGGSGNTVLDALLALLAGQAAAQPVAGGPAVIAPATPAVKAPAAPAVKAPAGGAGAGAGNEKVQKQSDDSDDEDDD